MPAVSPADHQLIEKWANKYIRGMVKQHDTFI